MNTSKTTSYTHVTPNSSSSKGIAGHAISVYKRLAQSRGKGFTEVLGSSLCDFELLGELQADVPRWWKNASREPVLICIVFPENTPEEISRGFEWIYYTREIGGYVLHPQSEIIFLG